MHRDFNINLNPDSIFIAACKNYSHKIIEWLFSWCKDDIRDTYKTFYKNMLFYEKQEEKDHVQTLEFLFPLNKRFKADLDHDFVFNMNI